MIGAVLLACVLLRAYILLIDSTPLLYGDTGTYLYMARVLAPNWDRPIGYSLFLGPILALTGRIEAVPVAQAFLGIATACVWYLLAAERIGRTGGLVVAVLVGFNLQAIVMEHYLLSEAFSVFLLSLFFYVLWRLYRKPGWIPGVAVPILAVGLGLTRYAFLFAVIFSPIVLLALWREGRETIKRFLGQMALYAVIVGVGLGGYALWVGSYFGQARVTLFDGWALYQLVGEWTDCTGPKDRATALLCDAMARREDPPDRQYWQNIIWDHSGPVHSLLEKNGGSHAKTNDDLRRVAVQIIREDPGRYLRKVLSNTASMVTGWFYWTRVSSESIFRIEAVEAELRQRLAGDAWRIGYKVEDRFEGISFLLSLKYVALGLFLIALVRLPVDWRDVFQLLLVGFVVVYFIGCSATVLGDWSRFYVPAHNVVAMAGVGALMSWTGSRRRISASVPVGP